MSERAFAVFEPLRSTRALEALAHAELDLLHRAAVGFGFHVGRRNQRPSWWLPVVARHSPLFEEAVAELRRVGELTTDRVWAKPPRMLPRVGELHDLREACWMMLAESGGDGSTALSAVEGERLVVAEGFDEAARAVLLEALLAHATSTRIAAVGAGSRSYLLAHVLEDSRRRPTLRSYEAGGGLEGCEMLACFRSQVGPALFLPPHLAPSARAFDLFVALWRANPGLFGLPECERLAAVLEGAEGLETLALDRLDFLSPERIVPRLEPFARLEIVSLEETPGALEALRARLEAPRDGLLTGQGLVLRPQRSIDDPDETLRELDAEIERLELHRAYVRVSHTESPVLYRFALDELAALADALRSFPPGELARSKIEYAFQATPGEPAGWHYLLCPAATRRHEPFHWGRWLERLGRARGPGRALVFRHDPLWSRDYALDRPGLEVFVPSGTRLFPSLHSWREGEIDRHLRRMLTGGWFPRREGLEVPERALCLFDGEVDDDELRVVVLPREDFLPLRQELAWINDNLLLQHELGEVRGRIGELAAVVRDRRISEALERDARERVDRFEAVGRQTEEAVARAAERLLATLRSELGELREKGEAMRATLRAGRRRLKRAARVEGVARADGKALDAHVEGLESSTEQTGLELARLRASIEKTYRDLGTLRQQVEEQIEALYREYDKARRLL